MQILLKGKGMYEKSYVFIYLVTEEVKIITGSQTGRSEFLGRNQG